MNNQDQLSSFVYREVDGSNSRSVQRVGIVGARLEWRLI